MRSMRRWVVGAAADHDGGRIVCKGTHAGLVPARGSLTGEHLAADVGT